MWIPYIRNLNSVNVRRFQVRHINLKTWYMFNLVETKVKEPIPNRYLSTIIGTLTHYTLCLLGRQFNTIIHAGII